MQFASMLLMVQTMYDFFLITLLVIDDFGEGIPVAWAVSNKEDQKSITLFLEAVKTHCNDLRPSLFMSDDAIQYWNAWEFVFGKNLPRSFSPIGTLTEPGEML